MTGSRRRVLTARQRDALIDEISASCRRFMADVGALLAGTPDALDDHVEPACATSLRSDLQSSSAVLAPDFGEWAQLTIEGPLSTTEPTIAHIDFTDATTAIGRDGQPLRVVPRDLRISLVIDPVTMRVRDASFVALT